VQTKTLPAVSSMLNASKNTMGKISAQVKGIHEHVSKLEGNQRSALAEQKAEYEKQLQEEATVNTKLQAQNERTSTQIWDLEKGNDALRKKAKELQTANLGLRKALDTVQSKIGSAGDFINGTLDATNDDGAKDLVVLSSKTSENDQDEDNVAADSSAEAQNSTKEEDSSDSSNANDAGDDASDDSDVKEPSLLALSSRVHRALRSQRGDADASSDDQQDSSEDSSEETVDTSSDDSQSSDSDSNQTAVDTPVEADQTSQVMLKQLTQELDQLATEDKKSRAQLSKLFQEQFNKGKDDKANILSKQEALNSTRSSLLELKSELTVAVHHLEITNGRLQKRLHNLGEYLERLASFVVEPVAKAEKAIPTLPDDVTAFVQAQAKQALIQKAARNRHSEVAPAHPLTSL